MTIVVGYVPKPEGRAAVRRGVAEALLRQEDLLVVNAARGDSYADAGFAPEEELAAVRAELERSGVRAEVRQLVRGVDPADEIMQAAATAAAKLIVIGIRHRTPVGKLILGSTAQRVLLEAGCPVLAVKAESEPA
ncbi:MAG TPA: universal stress protein [Micromonosporaceae bacterium]